jgi:predicted RNA binding protein YcfA (HicA-like mRNA interferase family)
VSEKLPVLSGKEVIKALSRIGFVAVRQRGSHVYLRNPDGRRTVVPLHEELNRSTLMDILSEVKLTKRNFLDLLE